MYKLTFYHFYIPDDVPVIITSPYNLTEEELVTQHALAEDMFEKGLADLNIGVIPKFPR